MGQYEGVERKLAALAGALRINPDWLVARYRQLPQAHAEIANLFLAPPMRKGEALFTRADAARALKVSGKTLKRWIASLRIAVRLTPGGEPVIPASEIRRIAEARKYRPRRRYTKHNMRYWGRGR